MYLVLNSRNSIIPYPVSQNINLSNFKSLEAQKRIQTNNEILDVDQNLVVDAVSKTSNVQHNRGKNP